MARRHLRTRSAPSPVLPLGATERLIVGRAVLHQLKRDPTEVDIGTSLSLALGLPDLPRSRPLRERSPEEDPHAKLVEAVEGRVDVLTRQAERRPGRLIQVMKVIGQALGLEDVETAILTFIASCEMHEEFKELQRIADIHSTRERTMLMAAALDVPFRDVLRATHRRGRLIGQGILEGADFHMSSIVELVVSPRLMSLVSEARVSNTDVLDRILSVGPRARLDLEDFAHQPEVPTLVRLLTGALSLGEGPVHILLHGPPGTGKTELVRALARAVDARLCEVKSEDDDGDVLSSSGRTAALRLLDATARRQEGRLCILVDEADDLLPTRHRSLFGGFVDGSVSSKAFYNELLERTQVPVLWTTNSAESLDPAHLRRFSMIVDVKPPPRKRREQIAMAAAAKARIRPEILRDLAADERIPLALLETVTRSVSMSRRARSPEKSRSSSDAEIARHITAGFLKLAASGAVSRPRSTGLAFDAQLLNASVNLSDVERGLRARPEATILLSGPPGTGKSAWARSLADVLGRPLLVRSPSDILSKYVGEAERNLAAAFLQAESEGAVLLLDEADTFLFPRSAARHSWEVSQTNEMLVRVESFQGILVATTNAADRLDVAIHRRFDLKIELSPLTSAQRIVMVERLAEQGGVPVDDAHRARASRLEGLCPGDVAAVTRRLRFTPGASADHILEALEGELAARGAWRKPMGFQ